MIAYLWARWHAVDRGGVDYIGAACCVAVALGVAAIAVGLLGQWAGWWT